MLYVYMCVYICEFYSYVHNCSQEDEIAKLKSIRTETAKISLKELSRSDYRIESSLEETPKRKFKECINSVFSMILNKNHDLLDENYLLKCLLHIYLKL